MGHIIKALCNNFVLFCISEKMNFYSVVKMLPKIKTTCLALAIAGARDPVRVMGDGQEGILLTHVIGPQMAGNDQGSACVFVFCPARRFQFRRRTILLCRLPRSHAAV